MKLTLDWVERNSKRQFREADRETKRAAAQITKRINRLIHKWGTEWPEVGLDYLVSGLLLELFHAEDGILPIIDGLPIIGPATLQLSNAMTDYRDARRHEH
jgi:hypothetical protein